jgi:hypothetical protein
VSQEPGCGKTVASCRCLLRQSRCDGRHLCKCGGSWRNGADCQEDILLLPISWALSWTKTVEESENWVNSIARELGVWP